MKQEIVLVTLLAIVVCTGAVAVLAKGPAPRAPQAVLLGSGFTYQSELKKSGVAVNATCVLTDTRWNDATAGTQIGAAQRPA